MEESQTSENKQKSQEKSIRPQGALKRLSLILGSSLLALVCFYSIGHTLLCEKYNKGLHASIGKVKSFARSVFESHDQRAPQVLALHNTSQKLTKKESFPEIMLGQAPANLVESQKTELPGFLDRKGVVEAAKTIELNENFDPKTALQDVDNLINPSFKISKMLRRRTSFWFDIYTKYSTSHHVLHHTDFPWIVYEVVDTSDIQSKKKHRWTKHHMAKRRVRNRKIKIKNALYRLAKKRSYKNLKGLEARLFKKLQDVRGKKRYVFRRAARALRSQLGQQDFFLEALVNSNKYFPFMERHFANAGLPKELTRIPFVESSFNEGARSKVGASGIWQIMPASARDGLKRNKSIDERNSPFKATIYAAKHLKRDYKILRDWSLAVTAYNHGVGNLLKAKRRTRIGNVADLINRNRSAAFGFASKNFYTSFLAVVHAEAYHKKIFKNIQRAAPLLVSKVKTKKPLKAKSIAASFNLSLKDFLNLNLDLRNAIRRNHTLPRGIRIIIPQKAERALSQRKKHLFSSPIQLVRTEKNPSKKPST